MAETMKKFAQFHVKRMSGEVSIIHEWKATLHAAAMTPNLETWAYQSDLTNELSTGGGYTAGGLTLSGKTVTYIDDTSATAWVANTAYAAGDIVRPSSANGHVYICTVAGTSHATDEPVWTTQANDEQPSDNGVIWVEYGIGYIKVDCSDIQWTSTGAGFSADFCVISDTNSGDVATNPLICLISFGETKSASNGGTFTSTINAGGLWTEGYRG